MNSDAKEQDAGHSAYLASIEMYKNKNYKEALDLINSALERSAELSDYYKHKANIYIQIDDAESATQAFHQAVSMKDANINTYYDAILHSYRLNNFNRALEISELASNNLKTRQSKLIYQTIMSDFNKDNNLYLTYLANKYGSDKGTFHKSCHGYTLQYNRFFEKFKDDEFYFLEIGLAIGGPEVGGSIDRKLNASPSVSMWLEYFKNSKMTGFDITNFHDLKHDRFHFIRGDAGKREDLSQVNALGKKFRFILDDASHASYHQLLTFSTLFECVEPGGLFMIEDLHWQPREIEANMPPVDKAVDVFRNFVLNRNFPPKVLAAIPEIVNTIQHIGTIHFLLDPLNSSTFKTVIIEKR